MSTVILAIDDSGEAILLQEALEKVGHVVAWMTVKDAAPARVAAAGGTKVDAIVIDADAPAATPDFLKSWRALDPPPAMILLTGTPAAQINAQALGVPSMAKPVDPKKLAELAGRAAELRFFGALSRVSALRAVGTAPSGDPVNDAQRILLGARRVDVARVRDALIPHAMSYVAATPFLGELRDHRALTVPEVTLAMQIDGAKTVRTMCSDGGIEPAAAVRLFWALACCGAVTFSAEPQDEPKLPAARVVAWARRRVRARRQLAERWTYYEMLEVGIDTTPAEVDHAARMAAVWYSPDVLAKYDLGDCTPHVPVLWKLVEKARETLSDPIGLSTYNKWLTTKGVDIAQKYKDRKMTINSATEAFERGSQALAQGDPFQAVSHLAKAARLCPEQTDFEAYAAWARYLAEAARDGGDRAAAVARERGIVENAILGRRPRPRALVVLGYLCRVQGDFEAAKMHLRDAIACDPEMAAAKKALTSVGG